VDKGAYTDRVGYTHPTPAIRPARHTKQQVRPPQKTKIVDNGAVTGRLGYAHRSSAVRLRPTPGGLHRPIVQGAPESLENQTVLAGDSLASIAQKLWGDSSLWYLLADANGLSFNQTLAAGQVLTIPDKVTNFHESSSTAEVYDPSKAGSSTDCLNRRLPLCS
jgi:nucleoid-associated protein YgaU